MLAPFLRLADAKPLQGGNGIGRQVMLVGRIDRIGVAGALEHLRALDGAANSARIECALDAGIGMLLASDDSLGEFLMRIAPPIDGADADLEMLGEFLVGGAETAHGAGLSGEFGFVDHAAWNSGAGGGV